MQLRSLGDTGLLVSALGMGCEALGGTDWGSVDVDEAARTVRSAWESGVTVFDTADVYGLGDSERRLSAALGSARHDAVIVSKFGVRWADGDGVGRARTWKDGSPRYLVSALEDSLRRLRVERIPVYLLHWPDPATPLEVTLGALREQQTAGKIGVVGLSNHLGEALAVALASGAQALELPLSLVDRTAEAAIGAIRGSGMGLLAYGVYAQGLLCGRYEPGSTFATEDRRHRLPHFSDEAWRINGPILERLRDVAAACEVTTSQAALRWALDHEGVSCALVGLKSRSQLGDALRAIDWEPTEEEVGLISGLGVGGPSAAPP